MKKILFVCFSILVIGCSNKSKYENVVSDYLQTHKGVKTDLKIEYHKFNVSDITVNDSIAILKEQYEEKKAKKIEEAQKSIDHWNKKIEEQKGKNTNVSRNLQEKYLDYLTDAKQKFQDITDNEVFYNPYEKRATTDLLAKKVDAIFSFFNPKIQTTQEIEATFILSPNGDRCYIMIKK